MKPAATFTLTWARSLISAGTLAAGIPGLVTAGDSNWTFNAELTLKETYDSNIFLQDIAPSPGVTNAAQPFQESLVTSVTPKIGFAFKPHPGFNVSGHYAPEITRYHSKSSEDYMAHRLAFLLHGVVGKVTWQMQNSFTLIDGEDEGLTFGVIENGVPSGAPAMGGIPIRDRRDAMIYRNSFGAFHEHGNWFFRPAASSYIHDFRTALKDPAQFPFYQNYVDRNDFNIGVDAGYKAFKDGYIFVAYRCGWQHESSLPPGSPDDYSNNYQRVLAGFEGKITDWLKLNLFIGPDWRNFNHGTPPGFDPDPVKLFIDGSAVLTVTKADTVTLTVKQFEQPAFGTPSAYEDITYEIAWRHRSGNKFTAIAGFKVYGGDWEAPVRREDWIYTPSMSLAYTHDKHLSAEFAYSYDRAESRVPNRPGREFTRHLVSLGVKYSF